MSDSLHTYLQDHLAGALHAIELLKAMRDHNPGDPLGAFAARLLAEVEADRDVLAALNEGLVGSSGGPKEWGAWLTEKVSRLKLKHGAGDGLGTLEALEFFVLGIARSVETVPEKRVARCWNRSGSETLEGRVGFGCPGAEIGKENAQLD